MKKDIIYIVPKIYIGGTEKHLLDLLPRIAESDYRVHLLILGSQTPYAMCFLDYDIRVSFLGSPKETSASKFSEFFHNLRYIFKISRYLKQYPEAIVHFYLPKAYILGMIACMVSGFQGPLVMSRRSLNHYQRVKLVRVLEKLLHKKLALAMANSQAVAQQLLEEGIPKEKIRLIYNGIHMKSSDKPVNLPSRSQLGIAPDAFVMMIIANLIHYKRHDKLLEALYQISPKLPPNWSLICVGRDNGILQSLHQQAQNYGLSNNIHWVGEQSNAEYWWDLADMGILASEQEGFSNVILEAMKHHVPMVVTNVGGNSEAILHEHCGLVVPPNDPSTLASAILRLVNDPNTRAQYANAAFQRVQDAFSFGRSIEQYLQCYNELDLKLCVA